MNEREEQAPIVFGLEFRPDSVDPSELPPERVQDSLAQVNLSIRVQAQDPNGTIERVVFTFEPASNPRGTATGTLQRQDGDLFARRIGLRVPVSLDEIYTVRVFAVDDDSLASNQAVGQVRVVADS